MTIHRGTAEGEGVTRIGNHNLLMAYVHIAHDCKLGNHIIMANGASLAGHIEIQDHATVGPFCGIHQFSRIGAYCFLGAFSVVNQDILPYSKTTAPRPLGVYGANKLGLDRRGLSTDDIKELEAAFRLLTRSKLNTTQALEAIEAKGFQSPHVKALVEFIRTPSEEWRSEVIGSIGSSVTIGSLKSVVRCQWSVVRCLWPHFNAQISERDSRPVTTD